MIRIKLTPEEIRHCRGIAETRSRENRKAGRFNLTTESEADFAGFCAEFAVALYYNVIVNQAGQMTDLSRSDLSNFIEVRSRLNGRDDAYIRSKDVEERAYVFCLCHELPAVTIQGWAWTSEIKKNAYQEWKSKRGTHSVLYMKARHLRPPVTLFDEIRKRGNEGVKWTK